MALANVTPTPLDPFGSRECELTEDHHKLLYLVAKYARAAESGSRNARGENESWIRETHLNVLIYEGIVADVFNYDYAPRPTLVGSKRIWMNVSQEGKDDVDDLREKGLVNGLKLVTDDLQPVTAFQVSLAGMKELLHMEQALRDQVDIFSVPGHPFPAELKLIKWQPAHLRFEVFTPKGYSSYSKVTVPEDVSYVTSPFMIGALRRSQDVPLTNNAERAAEAARGAHTMKQDDLSEAIVMENVSVLISEWVPFGSNQIVALNERLGTADRCQGGLLTAKVDSDPAGHAFQCDTGMTTVRILDHHPTGHINLEAEVNYPEDDGIIQVEHFCIHFSKEGTVRLCWAHHSPSLWGARKEC